MCVFVCMHACICVCVYVCVCVCQCVLSERKKKKEMQEEGVDDRLCPYLFVGTKALAINIIFI